MTGDGLIESARAFAVEKHAGLFRLNRGRQPYHVHVLEVGQLVAQSGGTAEEIAAGLLHDTREDTDATDAEIRACFGDRVADLVDGLLLSRHGPRQLPEDALHPVFEEQRGPIVGGEGGAHGSVTGKL